jgi:hypothetical protein
MRLGTLIAIIIVLGGGAAGFYFYKRNVGDGSESEGDSAPEGASEAQQEDPSFNFGIDEVAKYIGGSNNRGGSSGGGSQGGSNNRGGSSGGNNQGEQGGQNKKTADASKELFTGKLNLPKIPRDNRAKVARAANWIETNFSSKVDDLTYFRRGILKITPGGNQLPRRQQSEGLAIALLYQTGYISRSDALSIGNDRIKNFGEWWRDNSKWSDRKPASGPVGPSDDSKRKKVFKDGYPGGPLQGYWPQDLVNKIRKYKKAYEQKQEEFSY